MHLIETASEELSKPARDISRTRLQSLLELAVRTSSVASDPHADNVAFDMDPRSLLEIARAAVDAPKGDALAKVGGWGRMNAKEEIRNGLNVTAYLRGWDVMYDITNTEM